ncbi:aminodeoxychorismate synthase component I [Acidovorax temperans]|uniref:aminodeoxychorismate synthase component I n=1 Tax=Acidovorax temperans TaxID=80878 RepID=UPI0023584EB6|nr:aminodeoxychorismate synthase component I [Acidovorax temperans]WCT23248.1 aminodeoxychorismate synthase component I [Acidovorax temperans]
MTLVATPGTWIDFTQPRAAGNLRLRGRWGAPARVLVAHHIDEVKPVLEAVHAAAEAGHWCVGHVRYEAAPAFDAALQVHAADGPLVWFEVHDGAPSAWPSAQAAGHAEARATWLPTLARPDFDAAIARIHQAIGDGELYQVNYTAPWMGTVTGEGTALFDALLRAQPGGYAACFTAGDEQVLSVSPELFFDWQASAAGGSILARPMKGTAARGATPALDAAAAERLRASPKERAENVMIVDLLRNDLSRIAEPHTVRVPELFHTQALPTVWQMTSDVQARTRSGLRLPDVFAALFPCGSVTGAPKVRAMQLIRELERQPRGIYCGAIGVVRPDGHGGIAATFNVPIRTVVMRGTQARCSIGSGITASAEAGAEWQEWLHKQAFLARASKPFEVLETLALVDGVYRHQAEHLARMAEAAQHFGYPWQPAAVHACLQAPAAQHGSGPWRVRLLLDRFGQPRAEAFALQPTASPVRLQLAPRPLAEAHGEWVRFKTTRRAHYAAFAPAPGSGIFDTVLFNAEGEITESTFGNLAMQMDDGRWLTPPLGCGLLPGVGRAVALREGRVQEGVVRVHDLHRVRRWAFINSLRGWLDAELV